MQPDAPRIGAQIARTLSADPQLWCRGPGRWLFDANGDARLDELGAPMRSGCLLEHIGWRCEPFDARVLAPFVTLTRIPLQVWNDFPGRTVAHVVSLCRRVAGGW